MALDRDGTPLLEVDTRWAAGVRPRLTEKFPASVKSRQTIEMWVKAYIDTLAADEGFMSVLCAPNIIVGVVRYTRSKAAAVRLARAEGGARQTEPEAFAAVFQPATNRWESANGRG